MVSMLFVSLTPYMHNKSSGTAPMARTGAPGESTCGACHSGGSFTGSIVFTFGEDESFEYVPGETYNISITSDFNAPRHGFSITALDVSEQKVGEFTVIDENTTFVGLSGGRQYVGHKNADETNSWDFAWTAPEDNSGEITFYYVVNATNNNSATSGDIVEVGITAIQPESATTFLLTLAVDPEGTGTVSGDGEYEEGENVSISASPNEGYSFISWTDGENVISTEPSFSYTMPAENKTLTANFEVINLVYFDRVEIINVYPNPVSNTLTINHIRDYTKVIITNVAGQEIENINLTGESSKTIEVTNWSNGFYFISFEGIDKERQTIKLLKE